MLRDLEAGSDPHATIKCDGVDIKRISLESVSAEVESLTSQIAGTTKDVRSEQIELTVYRQNQDDLTIIDLPGMTRISLKGQHEDIENTIIKLYEKYMTPSETVLLNVVSAMVDFSTSKSLQMSRKLDRDGQRTLMCVTKVCEHVDLLVLQVHVRLEVGRWVYSDLFFRQHSLTLRSTNTTSRAC